MLFFLVLFSFLSSASSQASGWVVDPFNPPSLPLAVKSPYVNVWAPQGSGSAQLSKAWPRIWDDTLNVMGWDIAARVDGKAYNLMGTAGITIFTDANQTSVSFTPTRTSYLITTGSVNVNLTFFTPIEAHDLTRLSTPFSYLYLTATSTDGNSHQVQFYSDITGEWITGDTSMTSSWSANDGSDFINLQMQLVSQGKYQEIANRPQDATLYHCMKKRSGMAWEINPSTGMRVAFGNGTGLQNTTEATFHSVDNPFNALAISVDLGTVEPGSESETVVYAFGVVRDPVIQYTNKNAQVEERNAYYWANFSSIDDVIEDVLNHFDDALTASIELDNTLLAAANSISSDYAGLISLVTRQVMSAIEYTVNRDNLNISDVKAFMKDMGGVGSGQVNAVDVIYAAMPVYLYLNPDIIGYLLSPLLEYQVSQQYTNTYAAMDLGGPFPNATGNYQSHNQEVEQSANMIILSLAHAQGSGNGNILTQYYDLLVEWGNYLIANAMSPAGQTTSSSDGISSSNQTNLVLKGIIGIQAMAEISSITGHDDDASRFKDVAIQYYETWESLAVASDRLVLSFGSSSSGLIYNLYADKLLGLNVVGTKVYELQTSFYKSQISGNTYGLPVDSSNSSISRSDWMLFAASATTDIAIRDSMISQVHAYVTANLENKPFPAIYNPNNGSQISGLNSPAQGAIFAPLALTVSKSDISFPSVSGSEKRRVSTGTIVGSVVGAVAFIAIIIACVLFFRRRKQEKTVGIYNQGMEQSTYDLRNVNIQTGQTPFSHDNIGTIPIPYYPPSTHMALSISNPGAESEVDSSYGSGSQVTSASPSHVLRTKQADGQEDLRNEVDNLRREIEQMKEANAVQNTAPPSYDDGLFTSHR